MSRWLKRLLIAGAVFIVVWAIVVGVWLAVSANPNGQDLVVYLLALPLGVLIAGLFIRWVIRRWHRPSDDDDTGSPDTASFADDPADTRDWPVHIFDAALRLPIGADPQIALALLAAGQTRPGLDDELVDAQGFPVFAARVDELADDDLADYLNLPDTHPDEPLLDWSTHQRRALALADELIEEIGSTALPELVEALATSLAADRPRELDKSSQDPTAHETWQTSIAYAPEGPRALRLFVALPADWSPSQQQSAGAWLRDRLKAYADESTWPPISVELLAPKSHSELLGRLMGWVRGLANEQADEIGLLLTTESAISSEAIAQLDNQNRLFNQANPGGRIPAEGAAALLLATEQQIARLGTPLERPLATAHRPGLGRRDTSIRARGSVDGHILQSVTRQALKFSAQAADQVLCILNDTGIDTAQAVETGTITGGDFSHLDPASDCLNIGSACGNLGITACVSALALARARVLEQTAPVLVLGTQDDFERAALVVAMFAPEPTETDTTEDNQAQAA